MSQVGENKKRKKNKLQRILLKPKSNFYCIYEYDLVLVLILFPSNSFNWAIDFNVNMYKINVANVVKCLKTNSLISSFLGGFVGFWTISGNTQGSLLIGEPYVMPEIELELVTCKANTLTPILSDDFNRLETIERTVSFIQAKYLFYQVL